MCGGNGTGALLPIRRVLLFRRSLRSPYVLTHTHTHDLLTRKSLVHDGAQSKNPRAPDSRHYYSKPLASQPSYRLTIIACIKCIDFHAARATGGKTGRTDAHTHTDRRRVLWRACARITIHVFPYGRRDEERYVHMGTRAPSSSSSSSCCGRKFRFDHLGSIISSSAAAATAVEDRAARAARVICVRDDKRGVIFPRVKTLSEPSRSRAIMLGIVSRESRKNLESFFFRLSARNVHRIWNEIVVSAVVSHQYSDGVTAVVIRAQ